MSVLLAAVYIQPAHAQADTPAKPIHILVGFTPGGGPDITARYIGQKLGESWKRQVIVDNRPGNYIRVPVLDPRSGRLPPKVTDGRIC